jgi:ribosome biogenesis protein BMS1
MFSSALEASKFEGATIKTTSGIRGQIKKALRNTSVPAGSVRATFEDKIAPSDMIFLKSWYAVEVPKFYAPITNLLDQSFTSDNWIGLKTMGELKYINNIKVMPNENSLYKPIVREERVFAPLKIHKKLEEKLPFKFINKSDAVLEDPIAKQRVAVIREPKEAKVIFHF